jgi:omega-6 fatty acid desaturase (delta-12 desaturase)
MAAALGSAMDRMFRVNLHKAIADFGRANHRKAIWQIANTFIPYIALWVLMAVAILKGVPYWLVLLIAIPTAGFHIRIFIFFHDCCHGSFFQSRRAMRILGYISGILTFTPFEQWRRSHAIHHATVGDLDRRGVGDVWTLTVAEYQDLPRPKRIGYRIYRNPLVMFGLAPVFIFLFVHRLPYKKSKRRERFSVWFTNLALLAILAVAAATIGLKTYFMIQLPVLLLSGSAGVWLFYVQHQFEEGYWARHDEWDPMQAALQGSSYYKLPKVLQWFTGSIGLHHIHHVQPKIPNYNLQECSDAVPELGDIEPLTVRKSLQSLTMNLWDETKQVYVSFGTLRAQLQES